MSDTIFYNGKLKRTASPQDVYQKCLAAIKKTGPTKDWVCTFDEEKQVVAVDFGDNQSETLVFEFVDGRMDGFCKVYFPMDAEMYEKKSPFFACMKMLYSLKKLFSEFQVSDDYDAWEGFLEAMKYRARFRELTEEEIQRVNKFYDMGCTNHEDLLLSMMAEDLQLDGKEQLAAQVNHDHIVFFDSHMIVYILETWVYETCTFGKQGRVSKVSEGRNTPLNAFSLSLGAFVLGVEEMFFDEFAKYGFFPEDKNAFGVKHALVRQMFREKFIDLFNAANAHEKCMLAYRFFLSALDFAGFQFEGKIKNEKVVNIQDYLK